MPYKKLSGYHSELGWWITNDGCIDLDRPSRWSDADYVSVEIALRACEVFQV